MAAKLENVDPDMRVDPHRLRGGIEISVPAGRMAVSPRWQLGGFQIQFVALPAGESLRVDRNKGRVFSKAIVGEVNAGGRRAFPSPGAVTSTELEAPEVRALEDALLCIVREVEDAPDRLTDMHQLPMRGPLQELCRWQSFEEKFGAFTGLFNGLEAHMIPGFHLLDPAGDEIAYVHFWTTGKGVDVSTHNHGQDPSPEAPAFAEVHLVLRNGTGLGGMYQCDAPDAAERNFTYIQVGEEHGPFFYFDAGSGRPRLKDNGAVDYPWHGWQGGADDAPGEAYDLVAAFEISPAYARV